MVCLYGTTLNKIPEFKVVHVCRQKIIMDNRHFPMRLTRTRQHHGGTGLPE